MVRRTVEPRVTLPTLNDVGGVSVHVPIFFSGLLVNTRPFICIVLVSYAMFATDAEAEIPFAPLARNRRSFVFVRSIIQVIKMPKNMKERVLTI